MTQREEKGMAMVHGTQRTKRKEKNKVAKLKKAETREKIGEDQKVERKNRREKGRERQRKKMGKGVAKEKKREE